MKRKIINKETKMHKNTKTNRETKIKKKKQDNWEKYGSN